jgi:hypothetical protein
VNSGNAPGGVIGGHLLDLLSFSPAETWPSLTSPLVLSPAASPESTPVPSDHGFRLDDDRRTLPALPDTAKENPGHAVAVLQRRALSPTVEHLGLMTKRDVLEDQRFAGAEWCPDQVQHEFQHPGRLAALLL